VLLLRSKDHKSNNPLASFATCLCRQRNELRTCAKCAGGLAVTTLPGCPDGPRIHLSGSAYMPSCIGPEIRLPLYQRIFCGVIVVKKCRLLCLAHVVFSYLVLHSSKILSCSIHKFKACLCVKMEFVVGTTSLSCELFSLCKAAFVHAGPTQLCTENGVSVS